MEPDIRPDTGYKKAGYPVKPYPYSMQVGMLRISCCRILWLFNASQRKYWYIYSKHCYNFCQCYSLGHVTLVTFNEDDVKLLLKKVKFNFTNHTYYLIPIFILIPYIHMYNANPNSFAINYVFIKGLKYIVFRSGYTVFLRGSRIWWAKFGST